MIMPFSMLYFRKGARYVPPYMGGRSTSGSMVFSGSMGVQREMVLSNYYFEQYFGENKLLMAGTALCLGLLLFAAVMIVGGIL